MTKWILTIFFAVSFNFCCANDFDGLFENWRNVRQSDSDYSGSYNLYRSFNECFSRGKLEIDSSQLERLITELYKWLRPNGTQIKPYKSSNQEITDEIFFAYLYALNYRCFGYSQSEYTSEYIAIQNKELSNLEEIVTISSRNKFSHYIAIFKCNIYLEFGKFQDILDVSKKVFSENLIDFGQYRLTDRVLTTFYYYALLKNDSTPNINVFLNNWGEISLRYSGDNYLSKDLKYDFGYINNTLLRDLWGFILGKDEKPTSIPEISTKYQIPINSKIDSTLIKETKIQDCLNLYYKGNSFQIEEFFKSLSNRKWDIRIQNERDLVLQLIDTFQNSNYSQLILLKFELSSQLKMMDSPFHTIPKSSLRGTDNRFEAQIPLGLFESNFIINTHLSKSDYDACFDFISSAQFIENIPTAFELYIQEQMSREPQDIEAFSSDFICELILTNYSAIQSEIETLKKVFSLDQFSCVSRIHWFLIGARYSASDFEPLENAFSVLRKFERRIEPRSIAYVNSPDIGKGFSLKSFENTLKEERLMTRSNQGDYKFQNRVNIIYYYGHGKVENGTLWLIPEEATKKNSTWIPLDTLIRFLLPDSSINLFLLDMCTTGGDQSSNESLKIKMEELGKNSQVIIILPNNLGEVNRPEPGEGGLTTFGKSILNSLKYFHEKKDTFPTVNDFYQQLLLENDSEKQPLMIDGGSFKDTILILNEN